jgi:hypothetical protein
MSLNYCLSSEKLYKNYIACLSDIAKGANSYTKIMPHVSLLLLKERTITAQLHTPPTNAG